MSSNIGDISTSAASTSLDNSRATAGRSPQGEPIAPGWTRYYDAEGKPYYFNHSTNKTQWDPPELSMAPAPPAAPQRYEQPSQTGPFASTSGSHYSSGMYGAPGTSMPQSMAPHGAAPGGFPGFEYSMGAAGAYQSPPMMGVASGGGMALPPHMTLNPGAGYGGQAVPQQVFLQPSMGAAPVGDGSTPMYYTMQSGAQGHPMYIQGMPSGVAPMGTPMPAMGGYMFDQSGAPQPAFSPTIGPGPPIQVGDEWRGAKDCTLFVFHLPNEMTNKRMFEMFSRYGKVISARIMVERDTGRSRGFGFVSYTDPDAAQLAIRSMNGFRIGHKRLKVQLKSDKHKGGGGHQQFRQRDHSGGMGGMPQPGGMPHMHPTDTYAAQGQADPVAGMSGYSQQQALPHQMQSINAHHGVLHSAAAPGTSAIAPATSEPPQSSVATGTSGVTNVTTSVDNLVDSVGGLTIGSERKE